MLDNLIVKLFITFGITLLILGCATESVPPPPPDPAVSKYR